MNPLSQIGILAIACCMAFGAGFYTDHKFNQASQVVAEKHVVVAAATDVQKSQADSQKLEVSTAVVAANLDQNKSAIHDRVVAQVTRQAATRVTKPAATAATPATPATPATATSNPNEDNDETNPSISPACSGFYLDVGTVRMLNASRAGVAFHTAGSGDEAGDSAPALCFAAFVDADQDLTKLYLDLAERHNALVDAVEQFQKEQRDQLGIKDAPTAQ